MYNKHMQVTYLGENVLQIYIWIEQIANVYDKYCKHDLLFDCLSKIYSFLLQCFNDDFQGKEIVLISNNYTTITWRSS